MLDWFRNPYDRKRTSQRMINDADLRIRGTRQHVDDAYRKASEVFDGIERFIESLRKAVGVPHFSILTYDHVMPYFLSNKPIGAGAVKGLMSIRYNEKPAILLQCYLDAADNVVCNSDGHAFGRVVSFDTLDDNLMRIFGEKTTVIVS